MMFGRFTERAQKVLALAQEEAIRLGHNNIGTEHILLALYVKVKELQQKHYMLLVLGQRKFKKKLKI